MFTHFNSYFRIHLSNRNSLFLCDAERSLGLASQPDKSTDLKNSIHSIEKINYKIARSAHFEEYQKIECVNELGRERERVHSLTDNYFLSSSSSPLV